MGLTNRNGKAPPVIHRGSVSDIAVALSHHVPTERDIAAGFGEGGAIVAGGFHQPFGLEGGESTGDGALVCDEAVIPDGLDDFLNGESIGKVSPEFLGRDVGLVGEGPTLAIDGGGDPDGGEDVLLGKGLLDQCPEGDGVADVLGGGSAEDVVIHLEGTSGGEGFADELFPRFHAIWIYGLGNRRDEYTYSLRIRKGYFDVFSEEPKAEVQGISSAINAFEILKTAGQFKHYK